MSRLWTGSDCRVPIGYLRVNTTMTMRRSLVLTDEARRHPFLASLPAHVRQADPVTQTGWRPFAVGTEDVRQFLMAYCACLLAVAAFVF